MAVRSALVSETEVAEVEVEVGAGAEVGYAVVSDSIAAMVVAMPRTDIAPSSILGV
jgi:hypothetical protein